LDLSRLSDLNVINVEWGNACIDQQLSFIGNYFEQNITGLYDNARDCTAQSDDVPFSCAAIVVRSSTSLSAARSLSARLLFEKLRAHSGNLARRITSV
jgi:hypothetical protein